MLDGILKKIFGDKYNVSKIKNTKILDIQSGSLSKISIDKISDFLTSFVIFQIQNEYC